MCSSPGRQIRLVLYFRSICEWKVSGGSSKTCYSQYNICIHQCDALICYRYMNLLQVRTLQQSLKGDECEIPWSLLTSSDDCNPILRIVCHSKSISSIAVFAIVSELWCVQCVGRRWLYHGGISRRVFKHLESLQANVCSSGKFVCKWYGWVPNVMEIAKYCKLCVQPNSNRILLASVTGSIYCFNYNGSRLPHVIS